MSRISIFSSLCLVLGLSLSQIQAQDIIEPHFPGCDESNRASVLDCAEMKMKQFIFSNLKYPDAAKAAGVTGKVEAKFVVATDGSIKKPSIVSGLGHGCDEEVLRIIGLMPKWIPGTTDGKAEEMEYEITVLFKNH